MTYGGTRRGILFVGGSKGSRRRYIRFSHINGWKFLEPVITRLVSSSMIRNIELEIESLLRINENWTKKSIEKLKKEIEEWKKWKPQYHKIEWYYEVYIPGGIIYSVLEEILRKVVKIRGNLDCAWNWALKNWDGIYKE